MSDIFKGVLRDFEKDKLAAKKALDARKALLYDRLPRVAEIDREMANLGLSLAQMVLRRQDGVAKVQTYKAQNQALADERAQLLYENGYDDDFFTDVYKCQSCNSRHTPMNMRYSA